MKPDFEKIAYDLLYQIKEDKDLIVALESAYLEGRKAQAKVDAEIARNYQSRTNMFMFNGKLTCGNSSHDDRWCSHCSSKEDGADQVAKAIESQEIK